MTQGNESDQSHAAVASRLLRDAAGFFRKVGEDNAALREQMLQNADVFEKIADRVAADPEGRVTGVTPAADEEGGGGDDSRSHAELAGRLLRDAAGFFRQLAEQNPTLAQQMRENADVFEQVAALLVTDPHGTLDPGAG